MTVLRTAPFAAVVLVLAACGSTPPAPARPELPPCPRAIEGIDALVGAGAMLLFGEVHGTAESPRFIGDVACHAARRGPITVGLEIPAEEQARLDAFVASAGAEADRSALLDGHFWNRVDQDGRSSAAMLALLDSLRADRAAGADVEVLAFDVDDDAIGGQERDRAMAGNLVEARRDAPERAVVALTGNIHSRRELGTPWDADYQPMGWFVAGEKGIELVTLDVRLDGGSAWICTMDEAEQMTCGAMDSPAEPVERTWYIERAPTETGHDGYYVVGPTTASPPAAR